MLLILYSLDFCFIDFVILWLRLVTHWFWKYYLICATEPLWLGSGSCTPVGPTLRLETHTEGKHKKFVWMLCTCFNTDNNVIILCSGRNYQSQLSWHDPKNLPSFYACKKLGFAYIYKRRMVLRICPSMKHSTWNPTFDLFSFRSWKDIRFWISLEAIWKEQL